MQNKKIFKCRSCGHKKLSTVFNLGRQPLANALLSNKNEILNEKYFPLKVIICNRCKLLQLNYTINPKILFKKYLWVTGTSKKVRIYRKFFFKKIYKFFKSKDNFICEVASNDGFFLEYVKKNNKVLGIDPATNLAKKANLNGIKTIPEFFDTKISKKIIKSEKSKPNIIFCRNVIPHVENINEVLEGIRNLLSDDGYGVIEFHNASHIIKQKHYDYIYHEHIFYYTLSTLSKVLKKQGLYPFDYFISPISGGSYVIIFSKKKIIKTKKFINKIIFEKKNKLDVVSYWQSLNSIAKNHKKNLLRLISKYSQKYKIVGYGASARSSTLLNYLNLNNKNIIKILDANPLKKNLFTPGTNIKINVPSKKNLKNVKVILLLAWNFKDEILKNLKNLNFKGVVIEPLPKIKITKIK